MNKEPENVNDDLVAYLDGELAKPQRESVESAIAGDENVRDEIAHLQKTWDLLDVLPDVKASKSFTQSTVELVALQESQIPSTKNPSKLLFWIGLLLIATLIPGIGFYFGFSKKKNEMESANRQMKQDLPIIENLPLYRSVNAQLSAEKGIEFLELLAKESNLFSENEILSKNDSPAELHLVSDNPPEVISSETVGPENLERLLLNQREFDRLERVNGHQENLRQFHQMIMDHPNSDEMVLALRGYHTWLKNKIYLGQKEIDRIMDLPPADRIEQIKKMEQEEFDRRFGRFSSRRRVPARQDFAYIKSFGRQKLQQLFVDVAALDATSDPEVQELKESVQKAPTRHHGFAILMQSNLPLNSIWSRAETENELEQFIKGMSQESQKVLEDLSSEFQMLVVRNWLLRSMMEIEDEDLQDFYDNGLTGEQRYSLRGLSTKERKQILTEGIRTTLNVIDSVELPTNLKELLPENKP